MYNELFDKIDCRNNYNYNYRTRESAKSLRQTLLYSSVRFIFLLVIVSLMFFFSFRYHYLSDMGSYYCSVVSNEVISGFEDDKSLSFDISETEKASFMEKALNIHFRYITPFTYNILSENYGYIDGKRSCVTRLAVTDSYGLTYNLNILTQPEWDVLFK